MDLLIISGLSGAGKTRVKDVLEDLDYYCIDNMPVEMMSKFAELISGASDRYSRVALVADTRNLTSVTELTKAISLLETFGIYPRVIFVEANLDTIVKRYKETRRRHPLDTDGKNLEYAVQREIAFLKPVRNIAYEVIDTSTLTLGNLQTRIIGILANSSTKNRIGVNIKSFGYKYGLPLEADLVFDVRFLPNPFYIESLKHLTGNDAQVKDYVLDSEETEHFVAKLYDMIEYLLPLYSKEGKRYLVICIGCTGGKHRSVTIANELHRHLVSLGYTCDVTHRDADKH